jgi:hypothetical protein
MYAPAFSPILSPKTVLLTFRCLWTWQASAAPCAPADVSIVQDNAYNDMISSYIQV